MIYFNADHLEMFNCIIHNFLEVEIFEYEEKNNHTIGDIIEPMIEKYLFREQYSKCIESIRNLYYWSGDSFNHDLDDFHEYILYCFLKEMEALQQELDDFEELYYDEQCRKLIEEAAKIDFEENREEGDTLESYIEDFLSVFNILDFIFEDADFKFIAQFYNQRLLGLPLVEEMLGTNIDYYFDLLPLDIQAKFKSKKITLTGEIKSMLVYLDSLITKRGLYKLFWEKDVPISEEKIQIIIENIMDAYFLNQGVDITRNAQVGNGKVDFKLFRSDRIDEKVLIEVKKASSNYLSKGYENQLIQYMQASHCKNAYYFIACFTDSEYKRAKDFVENVLYTGHLQRYINIYLLDVRKKKYPSHA